MFIALREPSWFQLQGSWKRRRPLVYNGPLWAHLTGPEHPRTSRHQVSSKWIHWQESGEASHPCGRTRILTSESPQWRHRASASPHQTRHTTFGAASPARLQQLQASWLLPLPA